MAGGGRRKMGAKRGETKVKVVMKKNTETSEEGR